MSGYLMSEKGTSKQAFFWPFEKTQAKKLKQIIWKLSTLQTWIIYFFAKKLLIR